MKVAQALFFIPLAIGQAAVAGQAPSLKGQSEQEPQVIAFYERQCADYADAAGLAGDQRDAYLAQCREHAPQIWPVGIDSSSD